MTESWPLRDLREVVTVALERGGHLLTAGEALVAQRLVALSGPAGVLWARLSTRVGPAFVIEELDYEDVPDVGGALAKLEALGLVRTVVGVAEAVRSVRLSVLRDACRACELPVSGTKAQVGERLLGHRGWWPPLVTLCHRGLLRRLERFRFLQPHPDRSALVAERLGHTRWASYSPTSGVRLFARRRALLRWEAALKSLAREDAGAWLAALADRGEWPTGLDLSRRLVRRVVHAARERERAGDGEGALALLAHLEVCGVSATRLAVRRSRCLELTGRSQAALSCLASARGAATPVESVAIERAGRRLGRVTGRGWAPAVPRRKAAERRIRVQQHGRVGTRPSFRLGDSEGTAEALVIAWLAAQGRRARHVEGALWSTLFALVFADAYFASVPGQLPTRFLSAPQDLGQPEFAGRRPELVAQALGEVRAGRAGEWVRRQHERWHGTHLRGARWTVAGVEVLAEMAEGLRPHALELVLTELLLRGPRASRGLPDLALLPGPPVRLPGAFPGRLGPGVALVEVKSPTDQLLDTQRVWHDLLARAGAPVELWKLVT